MLQTNREVRKMNNYYKNKLKDRLTYCKDWKQSIDMYLANKEITKKADDEYYKSKPLLKLILDVYFIPFNIIRFLKYCGSYLTFSKLYEKSTVKELP